MLHYNLQTRWGSVRVVKRRCQDSELLQRRWSRTSCILLRYPRADHTNQPAWIQPCLGDSCRSRRPHTSNVSIKILPKYKMASWVCHQQCRIALCALVSTREPDLQLNKVVTIYVNSSSAKLLVCARRTCLDASKYFV